MFAFALWDRHTGTLTLARDHLGQKPLYFGRIGPTFAFASELKAFAAHPDFAPEVDRGALALFLRHQYVPSPHTIWRGIFKLPAGCLLALDLQSGRLPEPDPLARMARYWCARTVAERERLTPADLSSGAALDRLDELLSQSVGECMIADVPLGAFLSGGIDSSLVVALMQKHTARPVKTFTIGFREDAFDEAEHARRVARHLGTEHTELYLTPEEARAIIPELPEMFDEPMSDPSQIPTFHVARLARQHVTCPCRGTAATSCSGATGAICWRTVSAGRRPGSRRVCATAPRRWRTRCLRSLGTGFCVWRRCRRLRACTGTGPAIASTSLRRSCGSTIPISGTGR